MNRKIRVTAYIPENVLHVLDASPNTPGVSGALSAFADMVEVATFRLSVAFNEHDWEYLLDVFDWAMPESVNQCVWQMDHFHESIYIHASKPEHAGRLDAIGGMVGARALSEAVRVMHPIDVYALTVALRIGRHNRRQASPLARWWTIGARR